MAQPMISESLVGRRREVGISIPEETLRYFKGIIGQIEIALPERQCRVLMLTSSLEKEGTTAVTTALGLVIASTMGRKTLLVDCNPIHPDIGQIFGNAGMGLNEYIARIADKTQTIYQTPLENLFVMPIGHKFTTLAAFGNPSLKGGIDMLREDFQYVLIDAAPLGIDPDMTLLCDKVDGVVLIIRHGKTRRETATRTKEMIERAGGRIIGVILNRRKFPIPAFLYNRL